MRILVGYTPAGMSAAESIEQRLGARLVRTIEQLDVHVVEVSAEQAGATLATLAHDRRVRYAQLDGPVRALRIPNDAFWSTEWSPLQTNAPQAWDLTTGSAQVVVAVIDSGIASSHPDLQGKVIAGHDFVNNDSDASDDNGHGTAVAGIIAANSDNAVGVAGYCWQCRLMPVKVLEADGFGTESSLAGGIVWAADHGAKVINLSLGGVTQDLTVAAAAQYAEQRQALVVAAAGNEGIATLDYPAALPGVVSVAASDRNDQLYSFSNSGSSLAAPGENSTTLMGGEFGSFLGTSSAAPVVSGIAALAWAAAPAATPAQVQNALESTAVRIAGVVHGRVDAYATLRALAPWLPLPSPQGSDPSSTSKSQVGSAAEDQRAVTRTRIIVGKLTGRRRSRTYPVGVGYGRLRADLALRKSRRVRLALLAPDGTRVAATQGRRLLRLRASVDSTTYRLVVRRLGIPPVSFRLALSYPAP